MDVRYYLERFESAMRAYAGEDPLDAWDKFLQLLDTRMPSEEDVCVVLQCLVQTFLQDKRYHADSRFINHCIRCASLHPEPLKVLSLVHGVGVGMQSAALYISWAEQCERMNLHTQADQVYQSALMNRAEPLDTLLHHTRMFQSRTGLSQTTLSVGVQDPQLVNQPLSQRESTQLQGDAQDTASRQFNTDGCVSIISQVENNPQPNSRGKMKFVSMYCWSELLCEGLELTFEELRARRYFMKLGHQRQLVGVQDLLLVNQPLIQRDRTQPQCDVQPSSSGEMKFVSMYCRSELMCEGSELTFEELRARRYFMKLGQLEQQRQLDDDMKRYGEEKEEVERMVKLLEELNSKLRDEPQDIPVPHLIQSTVPNPGQQSEPLRGPGVRDMSDTALTQGMQLAHAPCPIHPEERSLHSAQEVLTGAEGRAHTHQLDTLDSDVLACEDTEEHVNGDGFSHHSHITPNTSLGLSSATPSRALPSPTINTKEALDVIGNMFQGPALLQDSVFNTTHTSTAAEEDRFKMACRVTATAPSSAPFRIHQDENDENGSVSAQVDMKPRPAGFQPLMEIPNCKANVTTKGMEPLPSDSTGHAQMFFFPNHMQDIASSSSHLVTTPLNQILPYSRDTQHSQEDGAAVSWYLRQPAKLSPILEQSPPEQKQSAGEDSLRGAIMGEGESLPGHTHSLTQHSQFNRQALGPLYMPLTFPKQNLAPTDVLQARTKPSSCVYQCSNQVGQNDLTLSSQDLRMDLESDSQEPKNPRNLQYNICSRLTMPRNELGSNTEPHSHTQQHGLDPTPCNEQQNLSSLNPFETDHLDVEGDLLPERSFNITRSVHLFLQSPGPVSRVTQNVPMTPEHVPGFSWLLARNTDSDQHSSSSLDRSGFLLSERKSNRHNSDKFQDVPMSPAAEPVLDWIGQESPRCRTEADLDVMMSPCTSHEGISQTKNCDVPMSSTQLSAPSTSSVVFSDPWDDEVIVSLLAGLHPPLTSYPNLSTWSSCVPSITPKCTVHMGKELLLVDCVLGQGAFATVYQATQKDTFHKLIMKVQKPSNPWEFYMNAQLDARIEPRARHLYNQLHTAHLFTNGSVFLGELHNCGTLLNVVNLYKSRSEKVMPQPLVLYFAMCILDMVERLHTARIIHADVKPDNFLLGERFLQCEDLSQENLDHGLVLIDFGQSIDMTLFPEGTQFTVHCMTSGFQCTEMLSGRPWTYQTDYFGVVGTVYCMLFGSYMQVKNDGGVWKTGGVFRRNPHSDLWQEFFQVLLNIPDYTSLPCLRALRKHISTALMDNYSTKLLGLKRRLVVQLLESRTTRR